MFLYEATSAGALSHLSPAALHLTHSILLVLLTRLEVTLATQLPGYGIQGQGYEALS